MPDIAGENECGGWFFSALMITLAWPLKNGINDDVFNKNVRIG
jgi:hypothetical protein